MAAFVPAGSFSIWLLIVNFNFSFSIGLQLRADDFQIPQQRQALFVSRQAMTNLYELKIAMTSQSKYNYENMKNLHILIFFLILSFTVLFANQTYGQPPKSKRKIADTIPSPRLKVLANEISSNNKNALLVFWDEMKGKVPLIEEIPGNDKLKQVTFLCRGGDEMNGIILIGPFPQSIRQKKLLHLANSDVWYLTAQLPAASRFSYFFGLNGRKIIDKLNPNTYESDNLVEMQGAPTQLWIQTQPNVSKGTLKELHITSKILEEDRLVSVYLPANYSAERKYNLLVTFDGEEYKNIIPLPIILDNLIANKKINPTIAIFIDSKNQKARFRELTCDSTFADFIAKELIPHAYENYHITKEPGQTIITGSSLGGLAAAYTAFRYPNIFGNVLSQSGSFWYYPGWIQDEEKETDEFGWFTHKIANSPKLPIKFYIEVGLFETDRYTNQLMENRRLRDVLEAKNYTVIYSEYAGGHEYLNWRGSIADALIALRGK